LTSLRASFEAKRKRAFARFLCSALVILGLLNEIFEVFEDLFGCEGIEEAPKIDIDRFDILLAERLLIQIRGARSN
jgi:hypothetical protein